MAVKVTLNKSTNTLEFRPETAADNPVADYLAGLVTQAKGQVSKSASGSLDRVKASLLRNQAAEWDRKAHEGRWTLAKDMIEYYEAKAQEARALAKELDPSV
jgi:hypothetical protein